MQGLAETFDRVVVVNLARRAERMARFRQTLGEDWPFKQPERFEAVDGSAVPVPAEWQRGAGAWGCMLSHRQIIHSAIADGVDSILILEDDAVPVPQFGELAADFLSRVPADWDCLMLGGQHLMRPMSVAPGIVQCVSTSRTHAFAIRRRMMPGLLKFWEFVTDDHCDIVLAACMAHFKAYAPQPFLIGQSAGYSDITERSEELRFLSEAQQKSIAA
jgi:GR25 family glycosyltransferase involved in LPS biosynthesis